MEKRLVAGILSLCVLSACTTPDRQFGQVPDESGGEGGAEALAAGGKKSDGAAGTSGKVGSTPQGGSSASESGGTAHGGMSGGSAGDPSAGASGGAAGSSDASEEDLCVGKTCDVPPTQACLSDSKLTSYDHIGSCQAGVCSYASRVISCTCVDDACTTDPCIGVTCSTPPAAICKDVDTLKTYASAGSCSAGGCNYSSTEKPCEFGCSNGACNPDPCRSVTCDDPPVAVCKDKSTKTSYASSGACKDGACSYASTDTPCGSNKACSGAGACAVCASDTSCGASCSACGGSTPKCKSLGTTSQCVACTTNQDCTSATTPVCNLSTNTCVARPSCVGLAATCGQSGSADCCALGPVTGGSFYRNYDGISSGSAGKGFPATVSNFKLDKYEITVGRFRKFVAAYAQNMIPASAGKNPNNPSDPGWDVASNALLPINATALVALVHNKSYSTYADSPGTALDESRPINYLPFYVAAAFCIWDGGRLPTQAEWNYAAAGGAEQRVYAWGNAAPGADALLVNWGCYYNATGTCTDINNIARVGAIAAGNGKWGHADLNGNLLEYTADRSTDLPTPCNDCMSLGGPVDSALLRSADFMETQTSVIPSVHSRYLDTDGSIFTGARCTL